jgi:hypothetical protein
MSVNARLKTYGYIPILYQGHIFYDIKETCHKLAQKFPNDLENAIIYDRIKAQNISFTYH